MRYPWEKWFSKKRFKLVHGIDFECQTHSMLVMIYTSARKHGCSVATKVFGKDIQVTVRR